MRASDQIEYVRQLRSIVRDLTASSLYFAEADDIPPREIASSIRYAPLGDMRSISLSIATGQNELDRFLQLISEKKSTGSHFTKEAALDRATRSVRIHLVSAAVQAKPLPSAKKTQVLRRIQIVNDRFESSLVQNIRLVDPDALYFADSNLRILRSQLNVPSAAPKTSRSPLRKSRIPSPSPSPSKVRLSVKPTAHKPSPAPTPQVTKAPDVKAGPTPPALTPTPTPAPAKSPSPQPQIQMTAEKKQTVQAPASSGLCVYAGFIIKKDRCLHEEKLPFSVTPLDADHFLCESPNIICNPLLFGYQSDCKKEDPQECLKTARPICTQMVKNATEICSNQTEDKKYVERAVGLIKNNPESYEKYVQDFKDLCDEKTLPENPRLKYTADKKIRGNYSALLEDVLKTCEVANVRLETVTALYRSALAHPDPASSSASGRH